MTLSHGVKKGELMKEEKFLNFGPEEKVLTFKAEEKKDKPKKVKVVNCLKLNVRSSPEKKDNILFIVNENDELVVDGEIKNQHAWTRVYNAAGAKGYVLTQFIREI